MKTITTFIFAALIFSSCTKEVPEADRRQTKSAEEISAQKTIENFFAAYNSNDIETAISNCDVDYKGVVRDSDDLGNVAALKNDLIQYRKQYPEGKWEIKIDELNISGDFAYAVCSGSFMMYDPIEKKMNPIYSERSIRILKKQKNDGWKIYRYIGSPMFSYDSK